MLQILSRSNPNIFIEYVGKDNKGVRVQQSAIHLEIQDHIEECHKQSIQNCGILAPWGHGKTEQLIFRVLDWIGEDVNRRIQYICNTDENATARVGAIKKYIEEDSDYHKVYPWVTPSDYGEWGKHKITVKRIAKSKDGTLESWGITSSGTGSRSDIQVFDDPVDMRNAILNPAMRLQVKDSFNNVWLSRLVPGGFRIYIATVWHQDDLTHDLMKNSEWKFLIMKISEDFTCIECESSFKGKYTIPLWEGVWDEAKLKSQRKLIGNRAFERGYRQKAMSDDEMMFPSYEKIFREDIDMGFVGRDWPRIVGCDPFGQNVVIFVIALTPTGYQRVPIDIRRGKWEPKQTVYLLKEIWEKHRPQLLVVENNAAQEAIIQWLQEIGGSNIVVIPFTTGKQKADPVLGLPSLEVEFSNGSWLVPMNGIDPTDNDNPFNVWKRELGSYPAGTTWDCVMGMWFAREGARFLTNLIEKPEEPETVTQQELLSTEEEQFERVSIGDY